MSRITHRLFNNLGIAKLLLEDKANVNALVANVSTPFWSAARNGHNELLQYFLKHTTPDIETIGTEGISFDEWIQLKPAEAIEKIFYKRTYEGLTPLAIAIYYRHEATAKLLLDYKANGNTICGQKSLLYLAVSNHLLSTVDLLLKAKADPNIGFESNTPLYQACSLGNTNLISLLLEAKADVNKSIENGNTPLFISCRNNDLDAVKLLIKNKAEINKVRNGGMSPFMIAIGKPSYDIEFIKFLIKEKADINHKFMNFTCLNVAVENDDVALVSLLLDSKINVEQSFRNKPLTLAAGEMKAYKVMRSLLTTRANPNIEFEPGCDVLKMMLRSDNTKGAKLLLEAKTSINDSTRGYLPLIEGIESSSVSMVQLLINEKANVNGSLSHNPLAIAVSKQFTYIASILIDAKADINPKDVLKQPIQIAADAKSAGMIKLLIDSKSNINTNIDDEEKHFSLFETALSKKNYEGAFQLLSHSLTLYIDAKSKEPEKLFNTFRHNKDKKIDAARALFTLLHTHNNQQEELLVKLADEKGLVLTWGKLGKIYKRALKLVITQNRDFKSSLPHISYEV